MSTQHPVPGEKKPEHEKAKDPKEPAAPPAPPTPEEQVAKLTDQDKAEILREAVSTYLRIDFRDPVIRLVCQEFIDGVTQKQRSAAGGGEPHEHHSQAVPSEANRPKK